MPTPTEDTSFDVAAMDSAPALAPIPDPVAPPVARKPRKPRAPRKASIVEAIADAITSVEAIADAAPKTSKRKAAAPVVATPIPVAIAVAAPVFRAMRGYWCSCGKRSHVAIGAPTPACAHKVARVAA